MASRRKKPAPPVPGKPAGLWTCLPHEKAFGILTGIDNPLLLLLIADATLTLRSHFEQASPGRLVTIPKGSTIAIPIRGDLRALIGQHGRQIFIRCGRRVERDGSILYQRFDCASREPEPSNYTEAPPSGETDDLLDPSGGYAIVG